VTTKHLMVSFVALSENRLGSFCVILLQASKQKAGENITSLAEAISRAWQREVNSLISVECWCVITGFIVAEMGSATQSRWHGGNRYLLLWILMSLTGKLRSDLQ